jgi:hypothetical protein
LRAIYFFSLAFADFLIRITAMQITRTCMFNSEVYTMDFPNMTEEQFSEGMKKWRGGALIQDAFGYLEPEEREFLMTGTPPYIWHKMFSDSDAND